MSGFGDFGTIVQSMDLIFMFLNWAMSLFVVIGALMVRGKRMLRDLLIALCRGFLVSAAVYRRRGRGFSHGVGTDADCVGGFYEHENRSLHRPIEKSGNQPVLHSGEYQ